MFLILIMYVHNLKLCKLWDLESKKQQFYLYWKSEYKHGMN